MVKHFGQFSLFAFVTILIARFAATWVLHKTTFYLAGSVVHWPITYGSISPERGKWSMCGIFFIFWKTKKKIIMEALDKWKLCLLVVYWPCHDIGSDCWSLPLLSSIQLASDQLIQSSLWIRLSFPLQLITSSVIFHKNCSYCSQHQQQQQQQ